MRPDREHFLCHKRFELSVVKLQTEKLIMLVFINENALLLVVNLVKLLFAFKITQLLQL